MKMNGPSIKVKFTLWYLTVLSVILVILGTSIYLALHRQLHASFNQSLKERADQILNFRDIIPIVAGGAFEEEPGELISFYFYFDHELVNISHRQIKIPVQKEFINAVLGGKQANKIIEIDNQPFKIHGVPYSPERKRIRLDKFRAGRKDGPGPLDVPVEVPRAVQFKKQRLPNSIEIENAVLMVARSTKDLDLVLKNLLQILIFALPITLFLSGWGGIFLLNRILRPMDQISQTAREIGETDLTKRIKVETDDELGHLAKTINQMIDRLEKAFKRQKELTSDASHELRAPLALIQAEASLSLQKKRSAQAYGKSLEIISAASERMSGIIRQILFLARSDSGRQTISFRPIDVNKLLSDLCQEMDILCREKELTLTYTPCNGVTIAGDERLLGNLFLNLLTNAVRYTPAGGRIRINLSRESKLAQIEFQDTGIGIPPTDVQKIFERFYRVDKARSRESGGSGLGLSIADQIVKAHKGKIHVNSDVDKGSTFIVRLPVIS